MMHRKEMWAVLVVVILAATVLVYFAAHTVGQVLALKELDADSTPAVDTVDWQYYHDPTNGFSVRYPTDWQISTDGLSNNTPFIEIGDPLSGTSTYAVDIFIENNAQSLSSGEYVQQFLSADRALDEANAKSGPSPQTTPQFAKSIVLSAGSYDAYELYDVFEFDHDAERIYVAHGDIALHFDFPVAKENPNIYLPVRNNGIAHQIVDTLTFDD